MKNIRRLFAYLLPISALAVLTLAFAAGKPAASSHYLAFVGTYTNKTDSKGIYAYDFDSATGKLAAKGLAVETPDPSWVVIHPNGKFAYAANESGKQSFISAFSIDPQSAKLTLLNKLPALGEDPCYLSFDKTGRYLFVANYTSGNVVVFPILPDGKLAEHTALLTDAGILGPNKTRQDGPHAHWIETSAHNRFVYVADLGLDQVLLYTLDPKSGALSSYKASPGGGWAKSQNAKSEWAMKLSPGTGPRHVTFARDGRFTYVLGELKSTVTVFPMFGTDEATFHSVQSLSTLPVGFQGRNDAAEIALHPSGKWLFTSNRGHDSITVFAVDSAKGTLKLAGIFLTGGKEPRHFALDPTGKFLLVENQLSNSIVAFHINPATGALTQVSQTDGIPSPVCLTFLLQL